MSAERCRKRRPVGWICTRNHGDVHDGDCELKSLDPDPFYDKDGNPRRNLTGDSW